MIIEATTHPTRESVGTRIVNTGAIKITYGCRRVVEDVDGASVNKRVDPGGLGRQARVTELDVLECAGCLATDWRTLGPAEGVCLVVETRDAVR